EAVAAAQALAHVRLLGREVRRRELLPVEVARPQEALPLVRCAFHPGDPRARWLWVVARVWPRAVLAPDVDPALEESALSAVAGAPLRDEAADVVAVDGAAVLVEGEVGPEDEAEEEEEEALGRPLAPTEVKPHGLGELGVEGEGLHGGDPVLAVDLGHLHRFALDVAHEALAVAGLGRAAGVELEHFARAGPVEGAE